MENKNSGLMSAAMSYGFSLGIFWIVKYIFYMFSMRFSYLVVIYWGMSLVVPYLAYLLTKRYREDLGGVISFSQAWRFGVLIYLFAAMLVSIMHYVFYRFVAPPDFLSSAVEQTIASLKQMQVDSKIISSIESMNFSPIHMALQGILNNIFYGIILSLPVAALVCRRKS
ncbi:MAG: DUF4199 domain-containing protein [Parabacteroides sp.]|uniref:DUF4199 domain-containing protein n=1 Tax=Parabacteroides faecalis TaxID=2924040 RepID=A0ABT0BZK8_9BACT|nr:DUF4199 domain-containing protein [Parabacteroides faecalis]MCI7286188.1 DUF4199 domain-containing protein [Parabacteroides sp.]MDY6255645.1 DUF4199 domain-containing protein [Bacteroidales bacterium]MCJ2380169.1 DUF4199 domain-containing protein [Parabacteroides faecalis]MDD6951153.1 DUF4199 domain-containing protein [Parabacteroides sp.]MDD7561776.1 DUF4199 domain-containing protein [Parabacteroides sp.]